MIAMGFVSGLPRTSCGYDAIWVIVDRLTKTAHFLPIKKTYSTDRLAKLYVNRIVYLHGVLMSIVSNRRAILPWSFDKSCIRLWVRDWTSVQPFTLIVMVSLKGPFKLWRVCFGYVWWILVINGIYTCHWLTLHITSIIMQVLKWLYKKHSIEGNAYHLCVGKLVHNI